MWEYGILGAIIIMAGLILAGVAFIAGLYLVWITIAKFWAIILRPFGRLNWVLVPAIWAGSIWSLFWLGESGVIEFLPNWIVVLLALMCMPTTYLFMGIAAGESDR